VLVFEIPKEIQGKKIKSLTLTFWTCRSNLP
jgi:hypothetical protein